MLAKHSAMASIVHLSQSDTPKIKPKYDHSPHEVNKRQSSISVNKLSWNVVCNTVVV